MREFKFGDSYNWRNEEHELNRQREEQMYH